jgi:competence protein ComEC
LGQVRDLAARPACACASAQVPVATVQPLRIYTLDVGQGDAILIVSPEGKAILYDGGRASETAANLVAYQLP